MNSKDTTFARDAGAQWSAGRGFIGSFAKSFARTDEFREIVHAALPEVLAVWAGKSRIKKALAGVVGGSSRKGSLRGADFPGAR